METDSSKMEEELNRKLEMLEQRVTKVIEKLHGYVTENCAKASVREKCDNLTTFDLGAKSVNREK